MEHFLQIKILHGVATVLLFGGLLGLAFYAWRSWRSADAARIARGFRRIRLIGWPLLGLSLLALPVSGWWLAHLAGWPLGAEAGCWSRASSILLAPSSAAPLAGRLARVQHQAGAAETAGATLGEQTVRDIRIGLVMALLGTASFVAVAVLMVSKPL
ncbi:DUF2269 family protein [Pseudomonas paraeruginosa]|uniref:DUF2269 family protein n=1 Tax=Pseudomonas aeruginosa TaxID=287 RepID=UPI000D1BF6C0|nr:DUF2269 family protein [Pseudomonas aeruginosa]PTC39365.1 putative integral membrane protein [Pseudomonas aeruginosa]